MDLLRNIKNKTAKLRSLGKRLTTRLTTRRAINRIAPAPVEELAALDPTAQYLSPRLPSLSPRLPSLSPRTKVVTHIQKSFKKRKRRTQAIADLSKINSKKFATRRIQKTFRRASANPNLQECTICFGAMMQPRLTKTLRCGHKFHRKCIDQWTATQWTATNPNPSCPFCRASIEPERPYHLQTRISMPISGYINNTNTVNRVNALIAGMPNAATMIEAIGLLNETDLLIDSLPHSERAMLREAQTQAWTQTYTRLQTQASRQSRATSDAIRRANELIERMRAATTFAEARDLYDNITIIINSLPRNDDYRRVANSQWNAWLDVHRRVAVSIPRRGRVLTSY